MLNSLQRNVICFTALFVALCANSLWAFQTPGSSSGQEQQLLAVLQSDAPAAEKALVCKSLAIYGSDAAVPELAKLLPNPQLSSWARIALEAIPGEASNEALRNAADSLKGRLLVGVINSISFRQDEKAVELLIAKLNDSDNEVAAAAAVALGHIGNTDATQALREALASAPVEQRSAIAEGCVLSAERLHNEGNSVEAMEIYDEVRHADVPLQRIIEATRGAILTRKQEGIPLLIETFRSQDKKMFQLALGTAREFPGGEVDQALAEELSKTSPERAALLIQAMADRPETVSLPVVLDAAKQGDKQVRLSALHALQRVGDDTCLSALLAIATDSDEELAAAAQATLAALPGQNVNQRIAEQLPQATGEQYLILLQLIGQRRIDSNVEDVEQALNNPNANVRSAAFIALGEIVSLKKLSVLLSQVVQPGHAEDLPVAKLALKTASVRMPDREACAAELAAAMKDAPVSAQTTLLEILTDVGGSNALQTLASAAKSDEPELQDTASRLLGTWNSVAAAPVLLDLAKTAPAEKYRVRALRGYLGLARKFSMPDDQRTEMCQNAFTATNRISEHRLALDVLQLHPSPSGLKQAIDAMDMPNLKTDATATAMVIAQKLGKKGIKVNQLMSSAGFEKVKLEIVKAEYGAGSQQKDVTDILRKQASDSLLIRLAASGYNASFGGDPAPGVVKQLKIQYRINDKASEATFAENALILLPLPK
ncbi:HEAT repeat domain-containing protein [Rubinisphaera italica]|uniref:HEAT repeat protein n=1 Tax=Rubinisphaera italica TaxID=2527969 RepID=A0A5C5XEN3_9PLAN|nr:HEAT repeat domain-containing protein [Rubinisphaera italica]TWT61566.1 HEAT repeat protein [Rubinisphaera italica]